MSVGKEVEGDGDDDWRGWGGGLGKHRPMDFNKFLDRSYD